MDEKELRRRIDGVTAHRARVVLDHILKHGHITTEELKTQYGYNHPPRAARDVREQGIPLETFRVKAEDGRSIGAYRLGDPSKADASKDGGRQAFSKEFKETLIGLLGESCALCGIKFPARLLQVDHCTPYEVSGDDDEDMSKPYLFMLLCGPCNRRKSWTCENCKNWKELKDPAICIKCYVASPGKYEHLAMRQMRGVALTWYDAEVQDFDSIKAKAAEAGQTVEDYMKARLRPKT